MTNLVTFLVKDDTWGELLSADTSKYEHTFYISMVLIK